MRTLLHVHAVCLRVYKRVLMRTLLHVHAVCLYARALQHVLVCTLCVCVDVIIYKHADPQVPCAGSM